MESSLLASYTPAEFDLSMWSMSGLNRLQRERHDWLAGQYVRYYHDYVQDVDTALSGEQHSPHNQLNSMDSLCKPLIGTTRDSQYFADGYFQSQSIDSDVCATPDNSNYVGNPTFGNSIYGSSQYERITADDQQLGGNDNCFFEYQELEMYENTLEWKNNDISDQILEFAEKCKQLPEQQVQDVSIQQQYQVKCENINYQVKCELDNPNTCKCEQETSQEKIHPQKNTGLTNEHYRNTFVQDSSIQQHTPHVMHKQAIQKDIYHDMPVIDFDISDFLDTGDYC